MILQVIPATADQAPILANLLELYAHDFSEFLDIDAEEDGKFLYRGLPLYWTEPDRYAFLVKVDGRLAGLVLVLKDGETWDMAEFFILRKYRRRGIGKQVAQEIWKRFPGQWQVRVLPANLKAQQFWAKAIGKPPATLYKFTS